MLKIMNPATQTLVQQVEENQGGVSKAAARTVGDLVRRSLLQSALAVAEKVDLLGFAAFEQVEIRAGQVFNRVAFVIDCHHIQRDQPGWRCRLW